MQKHANDTAECGFSSAALQSVIAGTLLVVLIGGSLIAFNQIRAKEKENRIYADVMAAYDRAPLPEDKVSRLNLYIEQYPRGRYAAVIDDLIRKADKQRGLDLTIDASVVLLNRNTVPLTGRVQLLRPSQAMEEIRQAIEGNAEITSLRKQTGTDPEAPLRGFDMIGALLRKLQVQVVADTQVEEGQIRFSHLAPGEYILYGVACAGSNVIGLFDFVTVEEGAETEGALPCYSAYARDAQRRAERWTGNDRSGL